MLYALDLYESLTVPSTESNEADPAPRGALAELSDVYRQWGFDSGYAQATRDHLEMFVCNAEAVLGARDGTWAERDAARRLLYAFIARLERRMGQFGLDHGVDIVPDANRSLVNPAHQLFTDGEGI